MFLTCILYYDAEPGCDYNCTVVKFLSRVSYLPSYLAENNEFCRFMQNYKVHPYIINMEFSAVNRRRPSSEAPLGRERRTATHTDGLTDRQTDRK